MVGLDLGGAVLQEIKGDNSLPDGHLRQLAGHLEEHIETGVTFVNCGERPPTNLLARNRGFCFNIKCFVNVQQMFLVS